MALTIRTLSTGTQHSVCSDCGRWCAVGDSKGIRHSSVCDLNEQPESAPTPAYAGSKKLSHREIYRAAKQGAVSAVLTDSEIVEAVERGDVTASDAMNRDF